MLLKEAFLASSRKYVAFRYLARNFPRVVKVYLYANRTCVLTAKKGRRVHRSCLEKYIGIIAELSSM